ncbi:MAG: hypothetical protein ACLPWS_07340 [Rhodomicrobium sp.]
MHECDEGKDKASQPTKQTQQQQPAQGTQDEGLALRAGSLPHSLLEGRKPKVREQPPGKRMPGPDEARFTAGIVRFYEAVLKEPIPEKMLRLIDEIAKQERKS